MFGAQIDQTMNSRFFFVFFVVFPLVCQRSFSFGGCYARLILVLCLVRVLHPLLIVLGSDLGAVLEYFWSPNR